MTINTEHNNLKANSENLSKLNFFKESSKLMIEYLSYSFLIFAQEYNLRNITVKIVILILNKGIEIQHSHFFFGWLTPVVLSFLFCICWLIFLKIICLAAYRNATYTFSLVLADVSKKNAKSLSFMNFSAFSIDTFRLE